MISSRFIKQLTCTSAVCIATLVSGCTTVQAEPVWKQAVAGDGPGNPGLLVNEPLVVTNLPKSRSGNRPEYEVFGVRYAVLDSARHFREQGVASWYGSKFHGNATASGEIYDMHHLTAAHKHLPLPTFVRVTRQDNGASIVVKVNDRGPFVGDRIIDLSYAAASALDMIGSGKAVVTIEAISDHEVVDQELGDHDVEAQASNVAYKESSFEVADAVEVEEIAGFAEQVDPVEEIRLASVDANYYVQVGAFSKQGNARSLMEQVLARTQLPSRLDFQPQSQLFQVRVGPFYDDSVAEDALQLLNAQGFEGYRAPRSAGS